MARGSLMMISVVIFIFLVIDIYVFQGLKILVSSWSQGNRKFIYLFYWALTAAAIVFFLAFRFGNPDKWSRLARTFMFAFIVVNYFTKIFFVIILLIDDLTRLIRWVFQKFTNVVQNNPLSVGPPIPRSEFLTKLALVIASIPFFSMLYGIIFGAHDYRVRKVKIASKNLPASFDGLKIVQISDIHSGSFYNKSAVKRGVELILKQQADIIFFTGDLVNNIASEIEEYIEVFDKLKAPMGVYSTLGNHDYGDYIQWDSLEDKKNNLQQLIKAHGRMGWNLLMNENRIFERNGEKIALLGIENWGAGKRWPKHGRLDLAHAGIENIPFKLLLSHDPSHWDAQVRPEYKDIDLMLSGHTHGFQFGVEIAGIKWSPVQYVYKQWAGLYKEGEQQLYVNRGFGFIGFPGRVGMPPEITLIELKKA